MDGEALDDAEEGGARPAPSARAARHDESMTVVQATARRSAQIANNLLRSMTLGLTLGLK